MLKTFLNIFKVPDLRNRVLFTVGMMAIYRIGFFIPLPAVDQGALAAWAEKSAGGAAGNLIAFVNLFTGGSLSQSTIFGLGIMPYISAAIIFQLLGSVLPSLQDLKKEGPAGQQKIMEWTRYATVVLCLVQGIFWLGFLQSQRLVMADWEGTALFWICGVVGLTCGSVFLMWLGEQIDKFGIGSGASLIITAGIVASMPAAIGHVASNFSRSSAEVGSYSPMTIIFLLAAFLTVVAGSVMITQGQRRIPVQQAKHTRGQKVYGGQRSYLPLRVNHGGVMPIIFASSLMVVPSVLFGLLQRVFSNENVVVNFLERNLVDTGSYLHVLLYVVLIYFFAYFWTTVQFQPKEMATQLRDHGSFIPGLRPGPRTADYLETVMERITYVGAGFLAIIAVVPTVVAGMFDLPFLVTAFLGGTGLLIVVSVMLDLLERVESNLLMRNYEGFMGASSGSRGGRIRGSRSS